MKKLISIINPGFEDGFYNYHDIGELSVAYRWTPWWKQGTPEQVAEGYFKRPEFKPEDAHLGHKRIKSGSYAQKFFTTFGTHEAGIYQKVAVPFNAPLELYAWMQFWSWDPESATDGGYAGQIGIDPLGETDPFGASVTWGEWHGVYDPWDGSTWRQLSVKTMAQGPYATVFLKGACLHRAKHNDSYWDDVELYSIHEDDVGDVLEQVRALRDAMEQSHTRHRGILDEILG